MKELIQYKLTAIIKGKLAILLIRKYSAIQDIELQLLLDVL